MTIALPTLISLIVLAAASGALLSFSILRRRLEAALAVRGALTEESAQLSQQLSRAEALAASLRLQLKDALEVQPPSEIEGDTARPEDRVDDAGRRRVSGIQELNPNRKILAPPASEEISRLAESLWAAAGEPPGRDREFWFHAEAQLLTELLEGRTPAAPAEPFEDAVRAV